MPTHARPIFVPPILFPLAYLLMGGATAGLQTDLSRHLLTLEGDEPGDRFGAAICSVADLDGDGVAELLVGAPRAGRSARTGEIRGAVHLFSGRDGRRLWTRLGAPGDWLGFALADARGDLDGDGIGDVFVGAPMRGKGGAADALSGKHGGVIRSFPATGTGDGAGRAVASAGDVDGDRIPDLLMGAPHSRSAGPLAGAVELRSGSTGEVLLSRRGAPGDQLGHGVAAVEDLDGDGWQDLAVGAPLADAGGFNSGQVLVLSSSDGRVLQELAGLATGDLFGSTVSAIGDLDGDGRGELITTAPLADVGGLDSGAAYVHSSATGALLLVLPGKSPGSYLSAVGAIGDLDRDGRVDLGVGAASEDGPEPGPGTESGSLRLHSGLDGSVIAQHLGPRSRSWYGAAITGLGDVNGDGTDDLAIGAPGHDDEPQWIGRVHVLSGAALLLGTSPPGGLVRPPR